MTARLSALEWAELVDAFEQSGQTARAFAKEHGITDVTLRWWRTQLKAKRGSPAPSSGSPPALTLARVVREGEPMPAERGWPSAGSVSVVLGGLRVVVEEGFSPPLLRAVLSALRSPA